MSSVVLLVDIHIVISLFDVVWIMCFTTVRRMGSCVFVCLPLHASCHTHSLTHSYRILMFRFIWYVYYFHFVIIIFFFLHIFSFVFLVRYFFFCVFFHPDINSHAYTNRWWNGFSYFLYLHCAYVIFSFLHLFSLDLFITFFFCVALSLPLSKTTTIQEKKMSKSWNEQNVKIFSASNILSVPSLGLIAARAYQFSLIEYDTSWW